MLHLSLRFDSLTWVEMFFLIRLECEMFEGCWTDPVTGWRTWWSCLVEFGSHRVGLSRSYSVKLLNTSQLAPCYTTLRLHIDSVRSFIDTLNP